MSWEPIEVPSPPPDNVDTDTFKFRLPAYNADENTWGYGLNGNWYALDIILAAIQATANAAMPKAGGEFTGDVTFDGAKVGTNAAPAVEVNALAWNVGPAGGAVLASCDEDGNITAVDVTATSDIALKKDVAPVSDALLLAAITQITPSTFTWIESGDQALGIIAQQVEPLLPLAVKLSSRPITGEGRNAKTISQTAMIAALIGSIRALDTRVKTLERKVRELELR